jgi:hypothetical protein
LIQLSRAFPDVICHDNRFKETPKGVLQYFPDLMANLVWNASGLEKFSASRSGDLEKNPSGTQDWYCSFSFK